MGGFMPHSLPAHLLLHKIYREEALGPFGEDLWMKKTSVNVAEAKQHLSDLLGRVAYGKETIADTRRGKPMAKLAPIGPAEEKPRVADVQGWLEKEDEFFTTIAAIVANRQKHIPHTLRRRGG
jgi:prevent-host-death family protein